VALSAEQNAELAKQAAALGVTVPHLLVSTTLGSEAVADRVRFMALTGFRRQLNTVETLLTDEVEMVSEAARNQSAGRWDAPAWDGLRKDIAARNQKLGEALKGRQR
jgi:hypothetical protein